MTQDASGEYLRNAVMTATPEQLQLMLYDGAIRFARQARDALARNDLEQTCEKLIRAQRILIEMRNGLRPEVNPELCRRMAALYDFVYNRLLDANMKHAPELIDEALRILEHQRETWRLLIDKLRGEAAASEGEPPDSAAQRSEAGFGRARSAGSPGSTRPHTPGSSTHPEAASSTTEVGATLSVEG